MDDYDVNINVPPPERKEDTIIVTGPVKNVERAIQALEKRNDEIESENEERRLQRFEMILTVSNKHHPKLIGMFTSINAVISWHVRGRRNFVWISS